MMEELLQSALGQGLYAAMFVALLFWVLKKNEEREKAMQKVQEEQTAALQEISRSLLLLGTQLSRVETYCERSAISYGEEGHRRFQMAGDDRLETGPAGWGGICGHPGSGRSDAGPKL